jgi:hypothetical protein
MIANGQSGLAAANDHRLHAFGCMYVHDDNCLLSSRLVTRPTDHQRISTGTSYGFGRIFRIGGTAQTQKFGGMGISM